MTIRDLGAEEARALVRAGFGRALRDVAGRCCRPLFWYEPPVSDPSRILSFGTVSLVHTGERPLGITAAHVVAAYLEARSVNGDLVVQIGNKVGPLHERIIDRSDSLDLCTLDFSEVEIEGMGGSLHRSPYPWPPKPPEKGRGVFFAGYPNVSQDAPERRLTWDCASGLLIADSVEPDRIMMALDRAYWEPDPTLREPAEDERWGGLSGGPLFSLVQSDSLMSWRFSGIVVQCLPIPGAQVLRAAPITPVRPDGSIRK
jgi:hypothetical protein